jgi:hypothetical protein
MTKTIKKDNIIASNLLLLASSNWIVADVMFDVHRSARKVLVEPAHEILPGHRSKHWGAWLTMFPLSGTLLPYVPRHQQNQTRLADAQSFLQILIQGWQNEQREAQETKAGNG